ncbi:MutS-related protein [Microbacter margulisiae]|uniref:DNA mismatch repair proteins mutS family domain-containing protein n=1 Tax=Microbacter margulisiae TaxID=1350067 RepID=A0A7W5DRE9_9PORP|nr:hypothetical protein [Microbacter margulisiae]MBB3187661.1 hypothetical protein [Microbacter margulisiae]
MSPFDYYQHKIALLERELTALKRKSKQFSWMRLLSFLAFAGFLILFFSTGRYSLFLVLSLLSLAPFTMLVNRHAKLEAEIRIVIFKLQILKEELLFLDHDYIHRDTGQSYTPINSFLANDFDLFGKGSLFQYLNRCSTRIGRMRLAENLCNPEKETAVIRAKQKAIDELRGKPDFMHDLQANGKAIPENGHEIASLQAWIDAADENSTRIRTLSLILACINIVWIILAAVQLLTWTSILWPVMVSLVVVGRQNKKIAKAHSHLRDVSDIFVKYTALFQLIEEEHFTAAHLQKLQQQLLQGEMKASIALKSLFRILSILEIRDNLLISFILNALFLLDIQTYHRLLSWKNRHKKSIRIWFSSLSEMEVLISFATFAFNNSETTAYPTIREDSFVIEAIEMGHPLLHPKVRVNNTFRITNTPSVLIITGANMAGKSTFLRTVAVNLLLAMNGAPVIAQQFEFTPCDILSSIKIQDSLSNNESYFYAELLRLKEILEHVASHPHTLVILDEILRGTNTKDKQTGSLGLLEKLISLHAMVIIATHDLSIGELETKYSGVVNNSCFEVELTNDQLFFDYKLKKGISKKLNASFLMQKMGIITDYEEKKKS